MGIGVSVFLFAVGAILTFAVDAEVAGINIDVIGIILMIAGGLGLLWVLLVLGPRSRGRTVVEEDRPVQTERRVYDDQPPV